MISLRGFKLGAKHTSMITVYCVLKTTSGLVQGCNLKTLLLPVKVSTAFHTVYGQMMFIISLSSSSCVILLEAFVLCIISPCHWTILSRKQILSCLNTCNNLMSLNCLRFSCNRLSCDAEIYIHDLYTVRSHILFTYCRNLCKAIDKPQNADWENAMHISLNIYMYLFIKGLKQL